MADNERDFKGVWIPKQVWLDSRLTALDKVILTEVDSLDQSERGCYASNKHIAEFCQCSETKVSKSISQLIKYGYLYVQNFDGRQRELKSRVSNFASQPCKKDKADEQKMQESNTDTNTVINTSIKDIVAYLNSKIGTDYKPTTTKTKSAIKARLAEGFTVEDFKTVIDKKCAEWLGDEKMEKYLRPETLFGTKFEGYLNARTTKREGMKADGGDSRNPSEIRYGNYI